MMQEDLSQLSLDELNSRISALETVRAAKMFEPFVTYTVYLKDSMPQMAEFENNGTSFQYETKEEVDECQFAGLTKEQAVEKFVTARRAVIATIEEQIKQAEELVNDV